MNVIELLLLTEGELPDPPPQTELFELVEGGNFELVEGGDFELL